MTIRFFLKERRADKDGNRAVFLFRQSRGRRADKIGEVVPKDGGWSVVLPDFTTAFTGKAIIGSRHDNRAAAVAALWEAREGFTIPLHHKLSGAFKARSGKEGRL